MHPTLRRAGLALASSALALSGLTTLAGPAAAAEHDPAPANRGADWLTGRLTDGALTYPTEFGPFTDYGLTIDAALGLAAVGGHDAAVQSIGDAIAAHLQDYISGEAFGDPGSTYAGPAGKALVMAHTAGDDPATYGGGDLVERVEATVGTEAPTVGRIADVSAFGDYTNVLGQAFVVQGLSEEGSARAADATAFLLQQQCSEGYFRLYFTPDTEAADQSCDGGKAAGESSADTDATALVLLTLQDLTSDPAVAESLEEAEAWLLDQQRTNGSFGGGTSTEAPNTNSTGVAGWALGERGQVEAAEAAAGWVRGRQAANAGACTPWSADDVGAIAYDDAALAEGRTDGITEGSIGQWLRATAQALPVLTYAPAATGDPQVLASPEYVRAGKTTQVGVLGAAPGAALCAERGGWLFQANANRMGEGHLRVKLPAGTGTRTVTVDDEVGEIGTAELHALGKLRVRFGLDDEVARGERQRVTVRNLAPGELVTVRYRGDKVDQGQAGDDGRFTSTFEATGRPGDAVVKVVGQFRNRVGSKTFTVTR